MNCVAYASLLLGLMNPPAQPAPKVEVMILGTYHMSNPGRDLHNMRADDVLAPKRQSELEAVASGLALSGSWKPSQACRPIRSSRRNPNRRSGTSA